MFQESAPIGEWSGDTSAIEITFNHGAIQPVRDPRYDLEEYKLACRMKLIRVAYRVRLGSQTFIKKSLTYFVLDERTRLSCYQICVLLPVCFDVKAPLPAGRECTWRGARRGVLGKRERNICSHQRSVRESSSHTSASGVCQDQRQTPAGS